MQQKERKNPQKKIEYLLKIRQEFVRCLIITMKLKPKKVLTMNKKTK